MGRDGTEQDRMMSRGYGPTATLGRDPDVSLRTGPKGSGNGREERGDRSCVLQLESLIPLPEKKHEENIIRILPSFQLAPLCTCCQGRVCQGAALAPAQGSVSYITGVTPPRAQVMTKSHKQIIRSK